MYSHPFGKNLLAAGVAVILIAGCATAPDGRLDDRQQTVAEGAVVGALVGGLLGAAVSDNHKGRGALIGAAAPLIAVAFADTWLSPAPARSNAG